MATKRKGKQARRGVWDDSISVDRGFARWSNPREGYDYDEGEIATPHGWVTAYAESKHTRLDFLWKGRIYYRNFQNRRYSRRGMVTLAKAFAAEIVRGKRHG